MTQDGIKCKMNKSNDLESTLKEKVSSLLEKSMEKSWGINIPKLEEDISDKLKNPHLDLYIPFNLKFSEAKKVFKKEFLKKELRIHQGNISQLSKFLGLDRRSIHRAVKSLGIKINSFRETEKSLQDYQTDIINHTIMKTLDHYKKIIQPQKMDLMYEEVPKLSKNIAKFVSHHTLTWKKAEEEFEKQFLKHALDEFKDVKKTADKIDIRVETLHRKIKKLGLKR